MKKRVRPDTRPDTLYVTFRAALVCVLAALLAGVLIGWASHGLADNIRSASAASVTATLTTTTTVTVGRITCVQEDSCLRAYAGTGHGGYAMFRHENGRWVRVTLVAGWTSFGMAPITCYYDDSCKYDYRVGAWWAAQQAHGRLVSRWVQLTASQADVRVSR